MRKPSELWMISTILFSASIPLPAHSLGGIRQSIEDSVTIRMYDMAHVDSPVLNGAKHVAEHIFLGTGIRLRWIDCLSGTKNEHVCGQRLRSSEIAMRIIQRTEQATNATGRLTNGQAIRCGSEDEISGMATIFFERTEVIAEQVQNDFLELKAAEARGIVLGHFMAHEIGHILLPTNAHSGAGIMKPKLDQTEWAQAIRGTLLFTRQEPALIRQRLLENQMPANTQKRPSRNVNE